MRYDDIDQPRQNVRFIDKISSSFRRQNDISSVNVLSSPSDAQGDGSVQRYLAHLVCRATSHQQRGYRLEDESSLLHVRNVLRRAYTLRMDQAVVSDVATNESQNGSCESAGRTVQLRASCWRFILHTYDTDGGARMG